MRTPRDEQTQAVRRRRDDGSLTRIKDLKLSLPEEFADDQIHMYMWANDVGGRINELYGQDWDVVLSAVSDTSEAKDKLRRVVGTDERGNPIYAVLLRKNKDFYLEDQRRMDKELVDLERSPSVSDADLGRHLNVKEGGISVKHGGYTP